MLGSLLTWSNADPDLRGFLRAWGFNFVKHFANRHACVIFWIHSWPATDNSKPNSPYQPLCLRSVTSGLLSVRLCMVLASCCWINWCHVRKNSIFVCFDAIFIHKSHYPPGYRSWFHFSFKHDIIHAFWRLCNSEDGITCNRCGCMRFKTPDQPSLHKLISWCLNLHQGHDIKSRGQLACALNGITQLGDCCMDT